VAFRDFTAREPKNLDSRLSRGPLFSQVLALGRRKIGQEIAEGRIAAIEPVELEITDNGIGFKLSSVHKGLGLKNMYNRAELFNGKVTIHTAPGEGCIVSVYIPT